MTKLEKPLPGALMPTPKEVNDYDRVFFDYYKIDISDADIARGTRTREKKKGNIESVDLLRYAIDKSFGAAVSYVQKQASISESLKNDIKEYLHGVFIDIGERERLTASKNYREWHEWICSQLIDKCISLKCKDDGSDAWTYGVSQKFVNLAIKYLVLFAKRGPENCETNLFRIGNVFLKEYNELDIPVDRYVIGSSWNYGAYNKPSSNFPILPLRNENCDDKYRRVRFEPFNKRYYEGSNAVLKSWNNWNKDNYDNYTRSLHATFDAPLDWEGYAWTVGKELFKSKKKSK